MTSELLVMNPEAIVLAADSAVTLGNGKIFNSANKIFRLVPDASIGIMIYNKAEFMGIPWDTLIKLYRDYRHDRSPFGTVGEWKDDFLSFISDQISDDEGSAYFEYTVHNMIANIITESTKFCRHLAVIQEEVSRDDYKRVLQRVIEGYHREYDGLETEYCLDELSRTAFVNAADLVIQEKIGILIEPDLLSPETNSLLSTTLINWFTQAVRVGNRLENDLSTGIVIAGFGEGEKYPSYDSFLIIGKIFGQSLFFNGVSCRIGYIPGENDCHANIVAFAQSDMINLFMDGIDPDICHDFEKLHGVLISDYPRTVIRLIMGILREDNYISDISQATQEKIIERLLELQEDIKGKVEEDVNRRTSKHSQATTDIVGHLPKDELAAFAETLINLTSFKRRMSSDAETVGGPIDVAVVSKKDGFVWLKRKHYFDPTLNPHVIQDLLRQ